MTRFSLRTLAVAAGRPHGAGAALNAPLVAASNFGRAPADDADGGSLRAYSREDGTPTWEALEAVVAALESAPDATHATSFASGMAAIAAVFELLPANARVVLPSDCYQGVAALAAKGQRTGRWTVERLAVDDTAGWCAAAGSADLVWLESPSNPLLALSDLRAILGAPRGDGTLTVVDNTFATPITQRPLELGADVVVHSATKFIGGHSDLLCGVAIAADPGVSDALRHARGLNGATPGALEAFLAVRGARTLAVRFERAQATAQFLAERLVRHPNVEVVRYPGLVTHPQHALAKEQLDGFGAVLSFDVRGGADVADAACAHVRLVHHATSLGGVESTMERRAALGGQEHLPPGLLRLSVGIEDERDLLFDLEEALALAQR
ncbi:Cystathionine gamma-synthase [Planctomycetes bacterium Pla163]|uniref:Cystathionine gamma-synthase n=1 Tax=Rohdeia mirabilis TaxID=2528008 RepID=A0A518CV33_9BACT|nr:Cystathionine gamma-synthase [Planctomycetes bacterium Pla163]